VRCRSFAFPEATVEPGRIQPAAPLDWTKLLRIFRAGHGLRTDNAAALGRFQFGGVVFGFGMIHALLDRRVIACFRCLRDLGRHRVQIDVDRFRQQGFFIEDAPLLNRPSKKSSSVFVLPVSQPRRRHLQAFHEPAQALRALARGRDLQRVRRRETRSRLVCLSI
jgi:hypothetical protein